MTYLGYVFKQCPKRGQLQSEVYSKLMPLSVGFLPRPITYLTLESLEPSALTLISRIFLSFVSQFALLFFCVYEPGNLGFWNNITLQIKFCLKRTFLPQFSAFLNRLQNVTIQWGQLLDFHLMGSFNVLRESE